MKRLLAIALLFLCGTVNAAGITLYFKQGADAKWDTPGNWWEDAAATVPHGQKPDTGSTCAYATGETATASIEGATFVNVVASSINVSVAAGFNSITGGTWSGTVTLNGGGSGGLYFATFSGTVTVNAGGVVHSGTYNGPVVNSGAIWGGIFNSSLTNTGTISSGTYTIDGFINGVGGIISGGTFTFSGADFTNLGTITGGTFSNTGTSGTFNNGDGIGDNGSITGGTFNLSGTTFVNNVGSTISGGVLAINVIYNAESIYGGTFTITTQFQNAGTFYDGVVKGVYFYNGYGSAATVNGGIILTTTISNLTWGTINGGLFSTSTFNNTGTINGGAWWLQGWAKINGAIIRPSGDPLPASSFNVILKTENVFGGGML